MNPEALIAKLVFAFDLTYAKSSSNPIINRNKINPKVPSMFSVVILLGGKILFENQDQRPKAVGPRSIPAMTSEITRGCRI